MTNPITLEQVRVTAQQVVKQFGPEQVNPTHDMESCVYTDDDGAHCIAGQIMVNLGHPVPGIDDIDNAEIVSAVGMWDGLLAPDAEDWLVRVQREADNGHTWEKAIIITEGVLAALQG